jgi:membrane-bound lytic murein transglycosylase D
LPQIVTIEAFFWSEQEEKDNDIRGSMYWIRKSGALLILCLALSSCALVPVGPDGDNANSDNTWQSAMAGTPPVNDDVLDSRLAQAARDAQNPLPASLWQRVRDGFMLPDFDGPLVQKWEKWYASRPDYLNRIADRARDYLYYVVSQVEKRGMPTEIALLPIVESAYNPMAYSKSGAAGLWQFIPSTGKLYGLERNWWYDGRRDVVASTNAALDYLQKLHDQFNDWNLALAAYNWGEGAVERAIARNQAHGEAVDYRSIDLPSETRSYVPSLLAIRNIVQDPQRFGVQLADIPDRPYFTQIETDQNMDVKVAARLAGMSVKDFIALNPAFNRPVIRTEYSPDLLIPLDKVGTFVVNLAAADGPLTSWQTYTVRRGDSIRKIAAHHHISRARLEQINGIHGRHRHLAAGQTLLLPVAGHHAAVVPELRVAAARSARSVRQAKHAVARHKRKERAVARRSRHRSHHRHVAHHKRSGHKTAAADKVSKSDHKARTHHVTTAHKTATAHHTHHETSKPVAVAQRHHSHHGKSKHDIVLADQTGK